MMRKLISLVIKEKWCYFVMKCILMFLPLQMGYKYEKIENMLERQTNAPARENATYKEVHVYCICRPWFSALPRGTYDGAGLAAREERDETHWAALESRGGAAASRGPKCCTYSL